MSMEQMSRVTAAALLGLFLGQSCEDYNCHDLANCPTETPDAALLSTCSGADCEATSDGTSSASQGPGPESFLESAEGTSGTSGGDTAASGTENTGAESAPSMSVSSSMMSGSGTSGEVTSEGVRTCPSAPEGVCECNEGETRSCALGGAKGACAEGNQACTEEGVYGECDVLRAASDDCSVKGNDDDCDGTANSGCPCVDGDTQACGPDTDVGQCQFGVSTCEGSVYGECEGAVERAPRRCDSTQDNDCDGVADNSLDDTCKCVPGDTQQCNKHPGFDGVGPCRPGNQTCQLSSDGTRSDWGPCSGDVAPKASDSCVEGDNSDCVGMPNTSCVCVSGQTQSCGDRYGSKGICASVSLTCQSDGTWPGTTSCMAAAKQEDCRNALDDNCDGTANDATSCPCSQVPSPCAHGTCSAGSGSAYTCDCSGTGYEGTLCDKPVAQVIAGPTGATSCEVVGVSNGGTVVAASCEIGEPSPPGYFWTAASGWIRAAVPAGYTVVRLRGLSSDGTKAAGTLIPAAGTNYGARWSDITRTAVLLNTPEWKDVQSMSANGSSLSALDPGGNLFVWTGGGANPPTTYIQNGGRRAIFSGDGTKAFTSEDGGFRVWTSSSASTFRSIADDLEPVAASNDGSVMVGYFPAGSPNTIYKYVSSGSGTLNSTANCRPLSLSSDGRYVLGKCASGLYRWADATPSTVQSLLASTGSTVTLRTDVEGVMSYDAKYVALPSSGTGIVVVHLPSP